LGCLVEKQRTTPDAYPLTLNSLRLACNQSTNRDPVVDYDDATVRSAAERLARRRLARFASGHSSRAAKYRQLLGEELGLEDDELALLALLMLRGPRTPGELRARADRLHTFNGSDEVHAGLQRLSERELVARLGRRPGQKEERYAHRLSEDAEDGQAPAPAPTPAEQVSLEQRVERLEREVAELRRELSG
jgi:uncharacterized protein YceH (UPF0502 family)